ncbi:MAG TPA: (d)CMP kinase [Verrucomicrobiae bacterium]|nr:(d)CMP kinase [Verrucomicrobiae bacterium]
MNTNKEALLATPIKGIIAIDGPAGSGKSTAARGLAERLGYMHLDSGAIYRCITFAVIGHDIPFEEEGRISDMASHLKIEFVGGNDGRMRIFQNGVDRTTDIRADAVTRAVPLVARQPRVRLVANGILRELGIDGGIVCDGRDIGSEVFPHAQVKFFLTASLAARAERTGKHPNFLEERDRIDRERAFSPLRKAEDAYELDTSRLNAAETLNILYDKALPLLPR